MIIVVLVEFKGSPSLAVQWLEATIPRLKDKQPQQEPRNVFLNNDHSSSLIVSMTYICCTVSILYSDLQISIVI